MTEETKWIIELILLAINTGCAVVSTLKKKQAEAILQDVKMIQNTINIQKNQTININQIVEKVVADEAALRQIAEAVAQNQIQKSLDDYTKNGHPPISVCDSCGNPTSTKGIILVRK